MAKYEQHPAYLKFAEEIMDDVIAASPKYVDYQFFASTGQFTIEFKNEMVDFYPHLNKIKFRKKSKNFELDGLNKLLKYVGANTNTQSKPMLKQSQAFGCGMYAVANALNLDNFATPERLELSKGGNRIGQLSKWLQEDGLDLYVEVFWYHHHGKKLPADFFNYNVTDAAAMPLLFNVRFSDEGKNHLIAAKLMANGTLLIQDSLQSEPIWTTMSEVNNLYHTVYGIFCFANCSTGNFTFLH